MLSRCDDNVELPDILNGNSAAKRTTQSDKWWRLKVTGGYPVFLGGGPRALTKSKSDGMHAPLAPDRRSRTPTQQKNMAALNEWMSGWTNDLIPSLARTRSQFLLKLGKWWCNRHAETSAKKSWYSRSLLQWHPQEWPKSVTVREWLILCHCKQLNFTTGPVAYSDTAFSDSRLQWHFEWNQNHY